jgi:hypothetical protein
VTFAQTAPAPVDRRAAVLDVPYEPQTTLLCGGAALAMVMRYWGDSNVHAATFAALVEPDAGGIRTSVLAGAAESRGWRVVPIGLDGLGIVLEAGQPAIALIDAGGGQRHYVVVVAATAAEVVVHDPARAPFVRVPRGNFAAALARGGGWMAVVTPLDGVKPLTGSERPTPVPVFTACSPQIDQAISAAAANDVARARQLLDAAMRDCPDDPAPLRERAGVAFAKRDYALASRLAARAAALDPRDEYTRTLLFSSRLLAGQDAGAIAAYDEAGGVPLEDLRIAGTERISQSLLMEQLGLVPGRPVTSADFGRARRRLAEVPGLESGAVAVTTAPGGGVGIGIAVTERDSWPTAWTSLVALGARGAVARDIGFTAAPFGRGDRLDVVWRFQPHRPAVGAAFTVPAPGRLPGNVELAVSRERQSFDLGELAGRTRTDETWPPSGHAVVGRARWSDWATRWLRWEGGLGFGRFDGRGRSGAVSGALELRDPSDHAALVIRDEEWTGANRFRRAVLQVAARTGPAKSSAALSARMVLAAASRSAPAIRWVGADDSAALDVPLRAHALFDDGRPDPRLLGRRAAGLSITFEHPGTQISSARVGWALFADVARIWRTVVPPAPVQIDVGVGLRVSAFGKGPFRFDVAMGARDHRVRFTAGWVLAWPSWTRGGAVASGTR